MSRSISRRDVLRMCTAFGALTLVTPLSTDAAIDLIRTAEDKGSCPTPTTVMGPFYKKLAPEQLFCEGRVSPGSLCR